MIRNYSRLIYKWLHFCCSWSQWIRVAFSQEGEDLILQRFFENKKSRGFYVDVGAHHPLRFSNTQIFYDMGWRGINIDPMPGSMKQFETTRKRDINLEVGIGLKRASAEYYVFNEPALNGFSKKISIERHVNTAEYEIIKTLMIDVFPLSTILGKYLSSGQCIDFMTIDVEGLDFDVLKSNDWNKYRPRILLVEIFVNDLESLTNSEISNYMSENGYEIFAKTVNTVFFIDKNTNDQA